MFLRAPMGICPWRKKRHMVGNNIISRVLLGMSLIVLAWVALACSGSPNIPLPLNPTSTVINDALPTATARSTSTPVPSASTTSAAAAAPTITRQPPATRTIAPTSTRRPTATRVPTTSSSGIITSAVMARDVAPVTFEPIGVTDTFSPDQPVLHAVMRIVNAPANTAVRVRWIVVDNGGVHKPNEKIGEYEAKFGGTRYLDYTFSPRAGMPLGTYRVEIFVNDKLDRTLEFTIAEDVPPTSESPTPATGASCPPRPEPRFAFPGFGVGIQTAESTKPNTFEPVNLTRVFQPNAVFHAIVSIAGAPSGTRLTAQWYATDTGDPAQCNVLIDSTKTTTSGTRNIDFTLRSPQPWTPGEYRVELYVNDALSLDVKFNVQ